MNYFVVDFFTADLPVCVMVNSSTYVALVFTGYPTIKPGVRCGLGSHYVKAKKATTIGSVCRVDPSEIRAKFGHDYIAHDITYVMGIDQRLTGHFAERFRNRRVLETCTGAGFTTIALAQTAKHVVTVEIEPKHQAQARENVAQAGVTDRVTFVKGDSLNNGTLRSCLPFDSAFLDPDWAVTGPEHTYRFRQSNTHPPADELLEKVFCMTPDVAIVLPPFIDILELDGLPNHERQRLHLDGEFALICLYFGSLAREHGETELIR